MSPIEGYVPPEEPEDPENAEEYVASKASTPAISHDGRPEWEQFQEGEHDIPPHFQAKAQVAGLLRRSSGLFFKDGRDGSKTDFLIITLDTGPIYSRTRDPRKKRLRSLITCCFYDRVARRVDKALRDVDRQLFSQPWMLINGRIETRFVWIDKKDLRKGMRPTGEMQIRVTSFFMPPVPKLSQVKEPDRDNWDDDGPWISV